MTASAEDIAWARQALADGRSMAYIASVLEMSERKAQRALFSANPEARRVFGNGAPADELSEPPRRTAGRKADPIGIATPPDRRRALLRRRFAKHWDMIWFQRARGMCGRTLRQIYGAETLIWSVGGGIDEGI